MRLRANRGTVLMPRCRLAETFRGNDQLIRNQSRVGEYNSFAIMNVTEVTIGGFELTANGNLE
jgi:hypothetical protein